MQSCMASACSASSWQSRYLNRIAAAATLALGLSKVGRARRAQRLIAYAKRLLMEQEASEIQGSRDQVAFEDCGRRRLICRGGYFGGVAGRPCGSGRVAGAACCERSRVCFVSTAAETAVVGLPRPPLALAVVYAQTGRKQQAISLIDEYHHLGGANILIDVINCKIEIGDLAGASAIAETMPHGWPLKEITAMICLAPKLGTAILRPRLIMLAIGLPRWACGRAVCGHCAAGVGCGGNCRLAAGHRAVSPGSDDRSSRSLVVRNQLTEATTRSLPDRRIFTSIVDGIASQLAHSGKLAEARSVRLFAATGKAIAAIAEELTYQGVHDVEATLADELADTATTGRDALRWWERSEVEDLLKGRDDPAASLLRSLAQQEGNVQLDLLRNGAAIGLSRARAACEALKNQATQIVGLEHRDNALRFIGVRAANARHA